MVTYMPLDGIVVEMDTAGDLRTRCPTEGNIIMK